MIWEQNDAHLLLWIEDALAQSVNPAVAGAVLIVEDELNEW
jgi:hypothetical protein